MAFGHLVPARPENPGCLAHHPEEQGALFGPLEHPRRRHTRFAEPSQGRAKGETEKVRGAQKGGQRRWETAATRRPRRAHEGPPTDQNARLRDGVKTPRPRRERDRMASVSRAAGPRQFPLRPYMLRGYEPRMSQRRPVRGAQEPQSLRYVRPHSETLWDSGEAQWSFPEKNPRTKGNVLPLSFWPAYFLGLQPGWLHAQGFLPSAQEVEQYFFPFTSTVASLQEQAPLLHPAVASFSIAAISTSMRRSVSRIYSHGACHGGGSAIVNEP